MDVRPLTTALGAEILGADIRDEAAFDAIRQAFVDHSVIVLRGQDCSPEDHLAFAKRFGEINVNRFFKPVEDHPEIAMVLKEKDQKSAIGEAWHTDHSYDQIPALGSILHAIEVPPLGGDTAFSSMAAAFDALSPTMQEFLKGLTAIHSSRHAFGEAVADSEANRDGRLGNTAAATQDARHPVVIRHPFTGRSCVYVNADFTTHIEGLSEAESNAILEFLYRHCAQEDFQCRVRWQAGDITMWDNRATWHKAINDYHGYRRLMHRVTVEGSALSPAA